MHQPGGNKHIGAIAGGAAGGIALIGLTLLAYLLLRRRSKHKARKRQSDCPLATDQMSPTHSDESRYHSPQSVNQVQPKKSSHELDSQDIISELPASHKYQGTTNKTPPAGLSPPLSLPPSYRSDPSPPQPWADHFDPSQQPRVWPASQITESPLEGFSDLRSLPRAVDGLTYGNGNGYDPHDLGISELESAEPRVIGRRLY